MLPSAPADLHIFSLAACISALAVGSCAPTVAMLQVVNLTESDEEQEAAEVIDLAQEAEPKAVVTTAQDAANTVRLAAACKAG